MKTILFLLCAVMVLITSCNNTADNVYYDDSGVVIAIRKYNSGNLVKIRKYKEQGYGYYEMNFLTNEHYSIGDTIKFARK